MSKGSVRSNVRSLAETFEGRNPQIAKKQAGEVILRFSSPEAPGYHACVVFLGEKADEAEAEGNRRGLEITRLTREEFSSLENIEQ